MGKINIDAVLRKAKVETISPEKARKFQRLEEIGQGGFGTVYKYYDGNAKRLVAVKFIKAEVFAEVNLVRFVREANNLHKIGPGKEGHIVEFYGLLREKKDDKDRIGLVMEYVEGRDLKETIESGNLSLRKAKRYAAQLALGLIHLHGHGIVHRDLKPSNIKVVEGKDGDRDLLKIIDFGLSKDISQLTVDTMSNAFLGSPAYMSPEQAKDPRKVDQRTDIWALGIIMYEMITGEHPFGLAGKKTSMTPIQMVMKINNEVPRKTPKDFHQKIDSTVSAIVMKCLEKNLDKRFQTSREVLRALQKSSHGKSHSVHWKIASAAIAVLLVLLLWMFFPREYDSRKLEKPEIRQKKSALPSIGKPLKPTDTLPPATPKTVFWLPLDIAVGSSQQAADKNIYIYRFTMRGSLEFILQAHAQKSGKVQLLLRNNTSKALLLLADSPNLHKRAPLLSDCNLRQVVAIDVDSASRVKQQLMKPGADMPFSLSHLLSLGIKEGRYALVPFKGAQTGYGFAQRGFVFDPRLTFQLTRNTQATIPLYTNGLFLLWQMPSRRTVSMLVTGKSGDPLRVLDPKEWQQDGKPDPGSLHESWFTKNRKILVFAKNTHLFLYKFSNRTPQYLADGDWPCWSDEGSEIYYARGENFFAASVDTGQERLVTRLEGLKAPRSLIYRKGRIYFSAVPAQGDIIYKNRPYPRKDWVTNIYCWSVGQKPIMQNREQINLYYMAPALGPDTLYYFPQSGAQGKKTFLLAKSNFSAQVSDPIDQWLGEGEMPSAAIDPQTGDLAYHRKGDDWDIYLCDANKSVKPLIAGKGNQMFPEYIDENIWLCACDYRDNYDLYLVNIRRGETVLLPATQGVRYARYQR